MQKSLATWQLINANVQAGKPVMLLYVVESRGSSPGRAGFFMMVTEDDMHGSIGGGMMEHKLVEKAKNNLRSATGNDQAEIIRQVHNKEASKHQSGMICSGEQTVLLYQIKKEDEAAIDGLIQCLTRFQTGLLTIYPSGLSFATTDNANKSSFVFEDDNHWTYQEAVGYKSHLYIIGGGHCSLALSKLAATLDFYIHLFDNRESLSTVEQNNAAHQKTLVSDYSELTARIPSGNNHYVAVMTFGYRTDDAVIRALFNKDFAYFGVLGSKAKIEKMMADYRAEGFDEQRLQKIHAPIGIAINSKTPEEIAVSIAAQIIAVKNNLGK